MEKLTNKKWVEKRTTGLIMMRESIELEIKALREREHYLSQLKIAILKEELKVTILKEGLKVEK